MSLLDHDDFGLAGMEADLDRALYLLNSVINRVNELHGICVDPIVITDDIGFDVAANRRWLRSTARGLSVKVKPSLIRAHGEILQQFGQVGKLLKSFPCNTKKEPQ